MRSHLVAQLNQSLKRHSCRDADRRAITVKELAGRFEKDAIGGRIAAALEGKYPGSV